MSGREAAAFYTRYAGLYDRLASDAPFVAGLRKRIVDALNPERGDVVVEMGCGTGANLPYLRERVGRGGTVIGFDVSAGVLGRARERIERAGWENVHVARADATRPPLRVPAGENAVDEAGIDGTGTDGNGVGRNGIDVGDVDGVLATFLTGMLGDPAGAVDDWCRLVARAGRSGETGDRARGAVDHGGRICVAGFARSSHPVGRLLNPAFAAGVRLAAPPGSSGDAGANAGREEKRERTHARRRGESAVARLDRRALEAHGRVHDRCPDASTTRSLAGFARITAGSVGGSIDGTEDIDGTDDGVCGRSVASDRNDDRGR